MKIKQLLFYITILFFTINTTFSQEIVETKKVKIGVKIAPPFVDKKEGDYTGISIDSWNFVNEKLYWKVQYVEYKSLTELLEAVKRGEVDFSINPITVTESRAKIYEFTQPFYISNTVVAKENTSAIWNIIRNIWSWRFISAVIVLVAVIFIFGFLIWIFERKKNKEQFGSGKWKGLGQGFWWSAVTMTTVGYGDKAPVTLMGRFIGIVWMFIAIIIISGLTAGIASSLTVQNLNKEITSLHQLSQYKVQTVEGSSTEHFLKVSGVPYTASENIKDGLKNIENKSIDLFMYDEPILQSTIEEDGFSGKISVLPYSFKKDYFAYCFPKNSTLIEEVNPLLVSVLKTSKWKSIEKKYHN